VTTAFGGDALERHGQRQPPPGPGNRQQGPVRSADNTRTAPNPQDRDGAACCQAGLADPDQRFRLTVEGNEDITDTNVLSAIDHATTTGMKARQAEPHPRVVRP
jgi:hemoglobin/transferrin/lactoferrin receptor protein